MVELGEDGDFDGAGLGEDGVGAEEKFLAGGEVFDGYAQDAVEVGVDSGDGGFELGPEGLLLGGVGGLWLGVGLRGGIRGDEQETQEDGDDLIHGEMPLVESRSLARGGLNEAALLGWWPRMIKRREIWAAFQTADSSRAAARRFGMTALLLWWLK